MRGHSPTLAFVFASVSYKRCRVGAGRGVLMRGELRPHSPSFDCVFVCVSCERCGVGAGRGVERRGPGAALHRSLAFSRVLVA